MSSSSCEIISQPEERRISTTAKASAKKTAAKGGCLKKPKTLKPKKTFNLKDYYSSDE
jgi:hypothetical protein